MTEQKTFLIGPNPTNQRLEDLDLRNYEQQREKFLTELYQSFESKFNQCLVVNLYGGPGTGKSTNAAEVFGLLKREGINCELVREYAKDKVWEENYKILSDQIYIFAKQHRRLHTVASKVTVVVTDSPLILSCIYGEKLSPIFHQLVLEEYNKYWNMNIFLQRTKLYNPSGRMQTLEEAKELDNKIQKFLDTKNINYTTVTETPLTPYTIKAEILQWLKYKTGDKLNERNSG